MGGVLLYLISPVVIDLLASKISLLARQANTFYTRTSIPTLMIAVGLIGIQMAKPYRECKTLNKIAGCTFGIYLFHFSIVDFLFLKFEPISPYVDSALFTAIYLLINVIALFSAGLLIEIIRKQIEKIYQPIIDKFARRLGKIFDKFDINTTDRKTNQENESEGCINNHVNDKSTQEI